ncbi:hypothetical protein [Saccharicrinis aurantiacus]|uniref:hypothetical protein n=1 Tax=Saccharicrinis aurantiacus TaxID=1849719 RepID=UPI0009501473|nr:hypothetical protein [Saccharicrinis aurantiacus]
MLSRNIQMLQDVAIGLDDLKNEVVFVGVAVAELYASNPELSEIRPTLDVDCVIELSSRTAHAKLEDNLRAKGFKNDNSKGAPICRWVYKNILVDIMPSDSDVLGFTNRWYDEDIENKIAQSLPNGTEVFIFSATYYLAAKFEAHKGRGGDDLRQSHDFEDIIYILENCSELIVDILNSSQTVQSYLKNECTNLLMNPNLTEGIESALPYVSEEGATEIILGLFKQIENINTGG